MSKEKSVSDFYKKSNKRWYKFILIAIGGGLGIMLLILGGGFEKNEKGDPSVTALPTDGAHEYAEMLEVRVAEICSGVSGAGKVSVFVSLKGGYRTVYAIDSQSNSSGYKNEIVMSGSGSGKQAVITAYENPEIAGVGIVCTGGEDPYVQNQIISLVSAALGISTNKIFVASAGSYE